MSERDAAGDSARAAPPPLKPRIYLMLASMAAGPAHGYELLKEIERRSDGAVSLDPGTLYRHIGQLLDEGLIEETDERPDPRDDDPRRKYYRLTAAGRTALRAEARRMAALVEEARALELIEPSESR